MEYKMMCTGSIVCTIRTDTTTFSSDKMAIDYFQKAAKYIHNKYYYNFAIYDVNTEKFIARFHIKEELIVVEEELL